MTYLSLCTIEIIDTNKPQDLFETSDANGMALVIRQVEVCSASGEHVKYCKLNKELIKFLKQVKIQI